MTDQELDGLMKRILVDSMKMDLEAEGKKDTLVFQPSSHYQKQMQLMLKDPLKWAKKKTQPMWKAIAQKVAVVLLIISLGFGTLMVGNPTAWAAFTRWVTEWYETHIVYRYTGESTLKDMPQYEIAELPEGFVENERIEFPSSVNVTYKNESGDIINLKYIFMVQGGATVFEIENSNMFDIEVNHMGGQFFESIDPGNFNTITWIDTDQNIQFEISSAYNYIDILRMAESVKNRNGG